jgi:hypothetical protein
MAPADGLRITIRHEVEPASIGGDPMIIAPHPYIRWIPLNPNHDATMRIGSEAPKQRRPFSISALKPWEPAGNRYLGSFLAFRR